LIDTPHNRQTVIPQNQFIISQPNNMASSKTIKVVKWPLLVIVFIAISFWTSNYYFQIINFDRTFSTSYDRTENGSKFLRTKLFYLETPNRWIHIAGGPTGHVGYMGSFFTWKGMLHYYYDLYAIDFSGDNSFSKESSSFSMYGNDHKIQFYEGEYWDYYSVYFEKEKLAGFQIPRQRNMAFSFTIYPSEAAYEYFDELHDSIQSMRFVTLPSVGQFFIQSE